MKKITIIAFLLAALAPMTQVWAGTATYYAKLTTGLTSSSPTGSGTVYLGSAAAGSSSTYSANTRSETYSASESYTSSKPSSLNVTFCLSAKANYGYKFSGWYDNAAGTGTAKSSVADYSFSVSASGTSNSSPTDGGGCYAKFESKTSYAVSLAVPAVSGGFASYSITGNNGYPGATFSSAGTLTAYYDETYTITCNLGNTTDYEFVGWDVNGTVTETSSLTLSQKFTSAATVKAVLREKAKYEVTLAAPTLTAGFGSYTVTGPGVSGSGLASGGTLQAYYDGTYTFACTLSDEIYEFVKWTVTDANGTTEHPESTLSKQFSSAATVTAVLNKKAEYQLTLVRPAGVNSYTVTGASDLSSGGTVTLHGATTCTFDCVLDDDYKFVKWTVTDENGTTDHTERTLTQTFAASDVTVSAVVTPKETYELTLVKPAGVEAYNVTVSGDAVSFSSAGKATVRELDTYTFECTIDAVQYAFIKWTVTDSNGTTEITDPTFTRTFSSAATVTAVLYKKGVYELTFVKPDEVSSYTITGPNGAVAISAEGKATVYELDSYTISCEYDDDNYEIVEWDVTTSSGMTASPENPLTMTFTSDATVTVSLIRLESYTATCLPVPSGCSYKVGSETVTTAEKKVKGPKGQPMTLTMSAASAGSGYIFAGWYIDNGDGSKTYLSKNSSETRTFEENVTIGADFASSSSSKTALVVKASGGYEEFDDLQEAFGNLESGDSITISKSATLAESAAVPLGVALSISSGVTLTIASGQTLYVDGTVSNSGTISGTVSKCTKLIKQEGQANGEPFNPYDGDEKFQVKYWKTSISTPSISVTSSASHTSIVNGYGETVYRGANANAFVCTTTKSIAINHLKSVKASYSSGTDAYNAVAKNSHNVSSASCNLMGSAASELVLLTAAGTVSVGSSTALNSGFIADCAGNNISFTSKQFGNAANVITINGATVKPSKLTNARLTAINCTTVTGAGTDGINSNQASYYTSVHFYDCGTFSNFKLSKSVTMTAGTPGVCFFSGGPYSPNPAFSSYSSNYHVYGGKFSSDPTSYLASGDLEAPKEGSYWVVRKIVPTANVAKVGTTEYESLQEAVNAAASSSGTVNLLPGIAETELDAPITVAAGKTVTIDLAGYAITAPNGAIINNGTLYLQDTSTFNVPGSITTASGNMIVNNGTMDVTYGKYTGNIQLNSGTFTTHGGVFVGTISVASGADPKVVANLRGGEFSRSTANFLRDGYTQVYCNPVSSEPKRYWVGQFPTPLVTSSSVSGAEKAWKLDFLSSSDLTLYKKTKDRGSHSSLADWQRRAELHSAIQPWSGYVLDCGLIFDRPVSSGSVTFYGKVQISMSESVGKDLAVNEDCPVLAHKIYESGYTPLSYGRYIDEVGSVTAGVKNNNTANVGTVCTLDLRVCTQDGSTLGKYNKLQAFIDIRYMLGGKKAAIDRNGNRSAFDSLTAAVGAVQDGERILIGADCSENVTLPGAGTFTVDPYGFSFTGSVSVPDTCFIKSQTEVTSSATAQGVTSARAVTYVVAQKVAQVGETIYDNLTDAVAAANGAVVKLLAATDETITLTVAGQSFTLNKNGFAFDNAKVVTTVEKGSVQVLSSDAGTVYTAVTSVVDANDGNKYNSVTDAVANVPGNDISVTVTANDTESVELPQGKSLTVTTAPGVTAELTVTPADGAFLEESAVEGGTKYESKKITVEMADPQSAVTVSKIDNGNESEVTDSTEINAAVDKLKNNNDVPRTDNTDKLEVVDKITVTPTNIVEEVVGGNTIIRSATFDVVPTYKAGQSLESLGEGQTLKFRLPVDDEATQLAAIIYHNGAQFGIYSVQTYNNEKFVEVESDAFSPYGYTLLDGETANPVAAIGTTGYASLAAAVAAASAGDTITMLADDTVSLTSGQEIEINKPLTITGPVDSDGDPLCTIYGTPSNTGYNDVFVASSSGTVTISNLAFAEFGNQAANSVNGHAPIFVSSGNNKVVLENLAISDFNRTAIKINGGDFLVKDCYINCATDVTNYRVGGIDIANAATGSIVGTTIVNVDTSNPTDWVAAALELIGSGDILVEDCDITSSMYGIFVSTAAGTSPGSSAVTVVNTTVEADVYSLINDSDSTDAEIAVESGEFTGMIYAETETGLAIAGGSFDDEVLEEYCADGYIPAEADPVTGMYTVKTGTYVAQNTTTGTKYATLADAFADASAGDTIKLLTDVELDEAVDIAESITLDLDGKTVSISAANQDGYAISVLSGTVTITGNGTIDAGDDIALDVAGGSVTIANGTFGTVGVDDGSLTITDGTFGALMTVGGTTTINGGTFNDTVQVDGGDVAINNGTFTSDDNALMVTDGTLVINGGTFVSGDNKPVAYAEDGSIEIFGGTFTGDALCATSGTIAVSDGQFSEAVPEEFCAPGYIPAQDPVTGLYTVKTGAYVARNMTTGQGYETLFSAVAGATAGDTVTLLTNVTESVTIAKDLTLTGDWTITGTTRFDAGATVTISNLTFDGNGTLYAMNIAGGAAVNVTNVTMGGGTWCNVQVNGAALTGSDVTMLGDDIVVAADGQTYTYRGETIAAADAPFGLDVTKIPGETVTLPFMDIVRANGDETVELAEPLTQGASMLFVANMPGDENQTGVTLPARFGCYSVTLGESLILFGDADTPVMGRGDGGWNEVVDTGAAVLEALDKDSDEVPVELTLNGDVDLGNEPFEFKYENLTIDGNGNAVSGTIKYTDDAGVVENIVLGTEEAPLVLDMTALSEGNSINLGTGIAATNVTIKVTEEQVATMGQTIVTWNTEGESEEAATSLESGIKVDIVDKTTGEQVLDPETGAPKEASLVWDAEYGRAYVGPCEARLTGPTHTDPIYTTFADAIAQAEQSGDTVTLMTNIVNYTGTVDILKSLTIDGAGYTISAAPVPADGHRNMLSMVGGSTSMLKIHTGTVELKNITLDGDATHRYTYLVDVANTSSSLMTENIRLLNAGELDASGTPGAGYGAGIHLNNAALTVKDGFYACTGGPTDGVFPFTGILPEGDSASVTFALTDDTDANPTVAIGNDLLLVGMIGAIDPATAQGILDYMKVPSRFIPYTLTLGDGTDYAFTGASPRTWNEIIDYGKDIMEVSTSLGYTGLDTASTPVEVGLLTDTVLPDTFTFADTNFTVNGNGNALSGTIKYTDNAGLIEDIVMGTEGAPLVLDMTGVTQPVEFGAGVAVTNVTIVMTEDQATAGTPVVIWDAAGGVDAPANEAGVTVALVDEHGDPTGDEADLIWDDELGLAYIGPCEARLTGPTHEQPIYTSLAHAIELAEASGDTVTLMTNIVNFTGTQDIFKSLTLDGAGHSISAAPVPADGHRNMFSMVGGSTSMLKIHTGTVELKNITLDGDATHRYTYLVSADNASSSIVTENVRLLHGGEIGVDSDGTTITPGNGYGAAIHLNNASLTVKDGFYACTGTNENGVTTGVFPFTAILPEGNSSVLFDLTGEPNDPANVDIGDDLLLVGMIGAIPLDQVQGILDYMQVPSRFIPYTLTLGDGTDYAFTGASPRTWNEIIDYGKDIMEVATANGFDGLDTATTPVEVGLLTDTVLPDTFTFADTNFTVNGNGNALSGTIEYTDNAGLIENIVMGTESAPLTLDMTGVTQPVEFGAGVAVTNVTIKMTEDQATAGTPVVIWDAAGGVDAPANEAGVTVAIVDDQGTETGDTAELIWDDELGLAYIGPCEARLTGPTHEQPIYTTLADAIARAADSGDTVTLMTNIVNFTGTVEISKSLTLDGAGHTIAAAPVAANGHRGIVDLYMSSKVMLKLWTGDITIKNIELDGDATHAYTFLISADNNSVSLTTENVRLVNGGELCGNNEGISEKPGAGYGAAIHLNNGASITVKDGFYACTGGKDDGVFPFTGILVDENGANVLFDLATDSNENPTVAIGDDLLLVGMPIAIPADEAQVILDYMKVPSRFIPYTLTLDDGSAYAFTGASPRTWNDIIDYGKEIMDVATSFGYAGLDTNSTPVEVGLLTDTVLPDTFTFADTNLTVNGNGNALSGTIEYTDNAGLIEDIVMGTETDPLVIDVTQVTAPIEFGAGVAVTNVTIKMTEAQAEIGTPIIIWDVAGGVEEPENPEGVSVSVVDAQGEPIEDPVTHEPKTASLIWDDELGLAYIGPCDARLTGPNHELPIYTTLASAIAQAEASGDTVTLMTNVTLTAQQTIDKDMVFNLNGYFLAAAGDAILIDSGASVLMDGDGTVTGNVAVASGTLTITNGTYVGSLSKTDSDAAQIVISGGRFSEPVVEEFCASGYIPATLDEAVNPYTVVAGYKVTFVNYNDTELFVTNVAVGGTAVYEGGTPTKPADASGVYTWTGWSYDGNSYGTADALAVVSDSAQTYTAQYISTATVAGVFTPIDGEGAVATNYFASLAAALAAVQDGQTVTMLANSTEASESVLAINGSVTLDLNGKTVTANDDIWVKTGSLTVVGSTGSAINSTGYAFYVSTQSIANNVATLTINSSDVTIHGDGYGVAVMSGGVVNLLAGSITSTDHAAICNNGSNSADTTINITGGTVTSGSTAIYHPGPGTLTVGLSTCDGGEGHSHPVITGTTGIEMRAGTLNVYCGTITETANSLTVTPADSSSTVKGAAVAISQHTTELPITVNISGGTLNATAGGVALFETDTVSSGTPSANVAATVTGGTFYGAVTNDNNTITIPGTIMVDDVTVPNAALFSEKDETQGVPEGYYLVPAETAGMYKVAPRHSVIGTTITIVAPTYDGTAQTPEVMVSTNGVEIAAADGYTLSGWANNVNAGENTASVTVTGFGAWIDTTNVTFSITQKVVTITIDNKTIWAEHEDVPELTAEVEGLVGSETLDYQLACEAAAPVAKGTYPITATLGDNPNYDVTVVPGSLVAKDYVVQIITADSSVTNRYEETEFAQAKELWLDGTTMQLLGDMSDSSAVEIPSGTVTFDDGGFSYGFTFAILQQGHALRGAASVRSRISLQSGYLMRITEDGALYIYSVEPKGTYIIIGTLESGATTNVAAAVPDACFEDKVGDNYTINDVEAVINAINPATGMRVWEAFALNQAVPFKVTAVADTGNATDAMYTTLSGLATNGFSVTYETVRLTKSGEFIEASASSPTPEFNALFAPETNAFYKARACITISRDNVPDVKLVVDSINTIGALKAESSDTNAFVAVPWVAVGGENITIADLVRKESLNTRDTIRAYDSVSGAYHTWMYEDGGWEALVGDAGDPGYAGEFHLSRGVGLSLVRTSTGTPIYLVGEVSTNQAVTSLVAANNDQRYTNGTTNGAIKPKWNLIGSPSVEALDIETLLEENNVDHSDQVRVPTGDDKRIYLYVDGKGWGYWGCVEVTNATGMVFKKSKFITDGKIPAGTGFWYLNTSTNDGKVINW